MEPTLFVLLIYPYDEEFYRICDRHEVVVIDEIPAVGLFDMNMNFLAAGRDRVIEELEKAGFEVDLNEGDGREKGKIMEYRDKYDAAFVFADVRGYAQQNNYRIKWKAPMANEVPWYAAEIPTVFVSLNYTNHFIDVPMVKTFINAHGNTSEVIKQTIEKIMGKSEFEGSYNENVWCDTWEAKR